MYRPALAAPSTSRPNPRAMTRSRQVGSLPQVIPLSSTPTTGTLEGGVGGALLGAGVGWLLKRYAKVKSKSPSMTGAIVGALAGGALGYYEAKNPVVNVAAGGNYTVSLPSSGGNLTINAPSGAQASVSAGSAGGTTSANYTLNGAQNSGGQLFLGSNTIFVSWTDGSGNAQTANVNVNVS